ncbi:MAG: alpha/beta fold hydrolase [Ignavibacteriales bacterium]|nr:alpha/beta fold hydrolase [Ignavibacteriales bacterium]
MNRRMLIAVGVFIIIGAALSPAQQTDQVRKDEPTAAGKVFVDLLAKGDYANAVAMFDSTMKSVMPEARLKETWESVTAQVGPLKGMPGVKTQKYQAYDIVLVTCQCERKTFDTRVVFDASGRIAGLFFAGATPEYKSPSYVNRGAFKEEEVMVGSGEWSLHGTLSVPGGEGPFAAIVLVHGSGPNDRDETIGPNKPFRDLAWGLASKGVAVLRYEKRTKEHGSKLVALKNTLTVKEETIDDALAALALLRKTEGIDAKRIYVLGHSLGGMLVPRIGKLDAGIAGFVVLAGLTRPLEDVILEQMTYIIGLKGSLSDADKKQLEEIRKQVDKVKNFKESDVNSSELVFATPPSYWIDVRGYDPPEVARTLAHPMLVLQGERDYQVTMKDFERWKAALGGKSSVEFKSYPKLNHLFIEGEGKSIPSEYDKVGHVAEYVIEDIAGWIKR